jgi:hypothetical protein
MMKKKRTLVTRTSVVVTLALAAAVLSFAGWAQAHRDSTQAAADTGIQIAFKLDPRLTSGLYMGERWVLPPIYGPIAQPGSTFIVEARAYQIDSKGEPWQISPEWIPADPDMVAVSPGRGHEVTLTVQRAGETSLRVTSGRMSKTLSIKATYQNGAIRVEISQ